MKVITRHAVLVGCVKHKKRRTFKSNASKPTNNCAACNLLWLSDRLETSLYPSDVEDVLKFSNTFKSAFKRNYFEYEEETDEKC